MPVRIRTLNEAIAEIKETDANTSLTYSALRRMVQNNEIPSISIGKRRLINLDILISYLENPSCTAVKIPENIIRPISEKISSGEYARKR